MTKKDFFRLLIKIAGLYFIISAVFSGLSNNIIFSVEGKADWISILWVILTLIIVVGLFTLMIYNADKIINWLKLDKGFDDERIDFQKIETQSILKLALFIIGGLLFIDNIPPFLSRSYFALRSKINPNDIYHFGSLQDYIRLFTNFLNIIIGYLLITNYNKISKLLKETDK